MTAEQILEGQVFLVDKPLDWTSFQAVNKIKFKLKKEFKFKKIKVGHAGTLDPKATGLLVVCTGRATKKISEIQDAPKEYYTEIKIGVQTESYDTEKPEILPTDISHITEDFVTEVLQKFLGEITQKPPIFSAIKVDGERAYDLARAGVSVEMKSRKTTTYIRSLAHDIGQELGVGAYLTHLRRTKIGEYSIEEASGKFLSNEFLFSEI